MTSTEQDLHNRWMQIGIIPPIGMFYEDIIKLLYTHVLGSGDIVVDGGANRGFHTFPMSECVGPKGHVFAIEAIPSLAEALESLCLKTERNNVEVVECALGASAGAARFHWIKAGDVFSGLQLREIPKQMQGSVVELDVRVDALDEIVKRRNGKVRFIKLDLEGGEFHALLGGQSVMKTDRPLIVFENGREKAAKLYGYTKDDWFKLFADLNYAVFDILGRRFSEADWTRLLPWYYIAAPIGSTDEGYIVNALKDQISNLAIKFK